VTHAVTNRVLKENNKRGDKVSRILDFGNGWRGYDICTPSQLVGMRFIE